MRFKICMLMIGLGAALLGAARGLAAPGPRGENSGTATNSATAIEYRELLALDDAAQAEVDGWTAEAQKVSGQNAATAADLEQRIRLRFEPIRQAYERFLQRHPEHAAAHLAFGNFLNDRQDEAGAKVQWEKALALDPHSADAYNNLAGIYSETGPAPKAFDYYAKAIELNPAQALYYHNFANTVCVLNKAAAKHFALSQPEVYAKALSLFSNALRLDPTNFAFAADLAQTYYSLQPLPAESALAAWTNALRIATTPLDHEQVFVHLARVCMLSGRFAEARRQLSLVTHTNLAQPKANLLRAIAAREASGSANPSPPPGSNPSVPAEKH